MKNFGKAGIVEINGAKTGFSFSQEGELKIMYPSSIGCMMGCPFCNSSKAQVKFLGSGEILCLLKETENFVGVSPFLVTNEGGGEPMIKENFFNFFETIEKFFAQYPGAKILISSVFPKKSIEEFGFKLIEIGKTNNLFIQVSMSSFARDKVENLEDLFIFAKEWKYSTGKKLIGNFLPGIEKNFLTTLLNPEHWIIKLSPLFKKQGEKFLFIPHGEEMKETFKNFEVFEEIPIPQALEAGVLPGLIN